MASAAASKAEGWGFESLLACHFILFQARGRVPEKSGRCIGVDISLYCENGSLLSIAEKTLIPAVRIGSVTE